MFNLLLFCIWAGTTVSECVTPALDVHQSVTLNVKKTLPEGLTFKRVFSSSGVSNPPRLIVVDPTAQLVKKIDRAMIRNGVPFNLNMPSVSQFHDQSYSIQTILQWLLYLGRYNNIGVTNNPSLAPYSDWA